MQTLTQPELLLKPFAQSGTKNTIPDVNSDASNPQLADLTNGFPAITSEDPDNGGLPPERADFNGLGYLTTTYDYFYQAGGTFTYSATIANAINGYPKGARLWYTDTNGNSTILTSTKENNKDDFTQNASYIGTSWVTEFPLLGYANTFTNTNTFTQTIQGSISGNAATVTNGVYTTGNQTIGGTKTFSSTIQGNVSGNAGTVTNGVYTTGNQTIAGTKTFSSTINGSINGNAATVTNGVYTTGNQTIAGTKTFSGSVVVTTQGNSDNSTKAASTAYVKNILAALYPVGSLYIGTQNSCPLASLISGSTWTLVATDRALWGGNGSNGNTTIAAGLPNITATFYGIEGGATGAVSETGDASPCDTSTSIYAGRKLSLNASGSSSVYGKSSTVQPPAYRVNVWRRTA